jgi:UDP-N-acetylmuramoylalanine--D-glutamate ligase
MNRASSHRRDLFEPSGLAKKNVTICGLGRHGGGVAAARFCAEQGGVVTVTDLADERLLADSLAELRESPIARYTLGRHLEEDFDSADVVVVNPAVKPGNDFVERARQAGAWITSETELFLAACRATVIAVTGTVGKSTTASMLAAILEASGRRTWLGGNIGHSLLGELRRIGADDLVVLEVSSFQLHWLGDKACWPRGVVITNCSANHLDWHGDWKSYVAAKQRLLANLPAEGFAVINPHDAEVASWKQAISIRGTTADWYATENLPLLCVPGEHNRINAACAATAAKQSGVDEEAITRSLTEFRGLPHRLSHVANVEGRSFFNDSKSTSPAATLAALAAMDRPAWLLLGGADKQIDLEPLVRDVAKQARGVAVYGTVGPELREMFQQIAPAVDCFQSQSMTEATQWCWSKSQSGDAILLSPACASTDQFADFNERGEAFEQCVKRIEAMNRRDAEAQRKEEVE